MEEHSAAEAGLFAAVVVLATVVVAPQEFWWLALMTDAVAIFSLGTLGGTARRMRRRFDADVEAWTAKAAAHRVVTDIRLAPHGPQFLAMTDLDVGADRSPRSCSGKVVVRVRKRAPRRDATSDARFAVW